jgi:uncharacterized protein YecE (DUF72 family)
MRWSKKPSRPAIRPAPIKPVNSRAGTSGWSYPQWKEGFYAGCKPRDWLSCYSRQFDTVELNSSYYRLPQEDTVRRWAQIVPAGFQITAKAWRGITHYARLRDSEEKLARCLSLFRLFGDRLGPVLFQLPGTFRRDDDVLADFLSLLPSDIEPVFEFRHPSWNDDSIYTLLKRHRVALCHPHMMGWLTDRILTTELLYIRLHGTEGWFKGGYSSQFLASLARFVRDSGTRRAYVFFNNTFPGETALENALTMKRLLRT